MGLCCLEVQVLAVKVGAHSHLFKRTMLASAHVSTPVHYLHQVAFAVITSTHLFLHFDTCQRL